MKIKIVTIPFKSELYYEELRIRDEVLRKPLELSIYDEEWEKERYYTHYGILTEGLLSGVLFAFPVDKKTIRFKQIAVLPNKRGLGLGKKLMLEVEQHYKRKGYTKIILDARKKAWVFYEKLGYSYESEAFSNQYGIHKIMRKDM